MRIRFKQNGEWTDAEIDKNTRLEVTDDNGHEFEIRPWKFGGGIDVLANNGTLNIRPMVSNQVVLQSEED